jgi:hypothetical protein
MGIPDGRSVNSLISSEEAPFGERILGKVLESPFDGGEHSPLEISGVRAKKATPRTWMMEDPLAHVAWDS